MSDDNTDREALAPMADLIDGYIMQWGYEMRSYGPNPIPLAEFITERLTPALPSLGWVKADDAGAEALRSAADEYSNGHQADKPRDNYRETVPAWLRARADGLAAPVTTEEQE